MNKVLNAVTFVAIVDAIAIYALGFIGFLTVSLMGVAVLYGIFQHDSKKYYND